MEHSIFKTIVISMLLLPIYGFGQQNKLGIEILGNHGYFGVDYERTLISKNKNNLSAIVGVGSSKILDPDHNINPDFSVIGLFQYTYKLNRTHQLFINSGMGYQSYYDINMYLQPQRKDLISWNSNLGYRYQFSHWSMDAFLTLVRNQNLNIWFGLKFSRAW